MKRDLEQDYKEYSNQELPDLWDRIEPQLQERSVTEPLEPMQESKQKAGTRRFRYQPLLVTAASLAVVVLVYRVAVIGSGGSSFSASSAEKAESAESAESADMAQEAAAELPMEIAISENEEYELAGDNQIQIGNLVINLDQVEVCEKGEVIRRYFHVKGDADRIDAIFPEGFSSAVKKEWISDTEAFVTETLFYEQDTKEDFLWNFYTSDDGQLYTFQKLEVEEVQAEEYQAKADGTAFTFFVTPYSVCAEFESDWLEKKNRCRAVARLKDGTEQEIMLIPVSTKGKKFEEKDFAELSSLGGGYDVAKEQESEDGRLTSWKVLLYEDIVVSEIEQIYVEE